MKSSDHAHRTQNPTTDTCSHSPTPQFEQTQFLALLFSGLIRHRSQPVPRGDRRSSSEPSTISKCAEQPGKAISGQNGPRLICTRVIRSLSDSGQRVQGLVQHQTLVSTYNIHQHIQLQLYSGHGKSQYLTSENISKYQSRLQKNNVPIWRIEHEQQETINGRITIISQYLYMNNE